MKMLFDLNPCSKSIPQAIILPRGHSLLISRDAHCSMLHSDRCRLEFSYILAPKFHNVPPTMATHSSILAWRIPWTEEPGRLQSTESQSQTRLSDCHSLTHYLPTYLGSFPLPFPAVYLNASYTLTQEVPLINSLLIPLMTET